MLPTELALLQLELPHSAKTSAVNTIDLGPALKKKGSAGCCKQEYFLLPSREALDGSKQFCITSAELIFLSLIGTLIRW